LTLDAQGSGSDIIIQSNGSQVASISDGGVITATSYANFLSTGVDDNATAVKLTVSDSGISINGDITFSAASQGIVLGNTSNVDANTLDDYEEGTFTPTWDGYTTPYGTSGKYVKIGTQVTVYAELITNAATDESLVQINNLPFQIAGKQGGGMVQHNVVGLYAYNINTKFTNNSTICKLWVSSGGAEVGIKYVSGSQPTFGGYSTLIWTLVYQST
jgi:hypothetical protein